MAKKDKDDEVQDQGALDAPVANTDGQVRYLDVPAGDTEGGPVNPVRGRLDESQQEAGALQPQEADPATEADNTSASGVRVVNEYREAGQPLNEVSDDARGLGDHGAGEPAGTGASAGAGAGTVDT